MANAILALFAVVTAVALMTQVSALVLLAPALVAGSLFGLHLRRGRDDVRGPRDPLTGLPDRAGFEDRVEVALGQAEQTGTDCAVLFIDLDRFKDVNDRLGRRTGDELLRAVAGRLRGCLPEQDTVARMGADEFAILLWRVAGPHDAVAMAQQILAALARPFAVTGLEVATSASIGITLSAPPRIDVATLVRHADAAMYRAKARGRNTFHLSTLDAITRSRVDASLESSLHAAIERDELDLHYQPQVEVSTGHIVGLEALARWRHPEFGLVPPRTFIPLAEQSGYILPLGEWVLETACRQARRWHSEGLLHAAVSVNVSAEQFARQRLDEVVARVLERTELPATMLELELTESVLVHDANAVHATLRSLSAMGVRCSLDDFGTGFSGLSYLSQMPIDRLKIDHGFIHHVPDQRRDRLIVGSIIQLARRLKLQVVAEGVETERQAHFLRREGCVQMQGRLFGRPMPASQVSGWLCEQHAGDAAHADILPFGPVSRGRTDATADGPTPRSASRSAAAPAMSTWSGA